MLSAGKSEPFAADRKPLRKQKNGFADHLLLHIGKTGGTSIRMLLDKLRDELPELPIAKLGHQDTLQRALIRAPDSKVAFIIRDPAARFVSGFNSRLRSGRPAHNKLWSGEEAAVFTFFPTANDLAESLITDDERMRSAAEFAMNTIPHLRRGYRFHLGSVRVLKAHADRIYFVGELQNLDEDIYRLLAPIPRELIAAHYKAEHQSPTTAPPLSEKAQTNLRTYWEREFKLYNYCRDNLVRR